MKSILQAGEYAAKLENGSLEAKNAASQVPSINELEEHCLYAICCVLKHRPGNNLKDPVIDEIRKAIQDGNQWLKPSYSLAIALDDRANNLGWDELEREIPPFQ